MQRLSFLGMTTVEQAAKENLLSHIRCFSAPWWLSIASPGTWSWGWPCGRRSPWSRSPSRRCRERGSSQRSWAPRRRAAETQNLKSHSWLSTNNGDVKRMLSLPPSNGQNCYGNVVIFKWFHSSAFSIFLALYQFYFFDICFTPTIDWSWCMPICSCM